MAVRTFLHYALEVPDQAVGQRFYEDFGLVDGTGSSDAVRLRPERLGRDTVLLYGGPRKRLHHLCYGAPGEDFARVSGARPASGPAQAWPRLALHAGHGAPHALLHRDARHEALRPLAGDHHVPA